MRVFAVVLMLVFVLTGLCFGAGETQKEALDDWYGMLEVMGGTTLETSTNTFRPWIGGKFGGWKGFTGIVGTEIDVDEETEAKGPVTVLAGATYNLGNLNQHGVEISWAKYFGFNIGLCGTYNWIEDEYGWRAVLSVVDLSFSGGGAERQRER
jgi:hypothetical protein